jgi:hypothetical protein
MPVNDISLLRKWLKSLEKVVVSTPKEQLRIPGVPN